MSHYRGGGGRRGGGSQQPNVQDLPLEQGIICSLKDSFGFIHCADRVAEVFFHYSSVVGGVHPDDLQIDVEVEFRLGTSPRDPTKLAAYQVTPLPEGQCIEWETDYGGGSGSGKAKQRFKGLVERAARVDHRGGGRGGGGSGGTKVTEGFIKLLLESNDENKEQSDKKDKEKELELVVSDELVRFMPSDYQGADDPPSRQGQPRRLAKGDLIECRVVVDRRTKDLFAREVTLIQSEKERSRIERERQQLASATTELGVIVTLKHEFGFIKSTKRRDHVYFHYSHLIVPDHVDGEDDFVLQEGQEVKFLVLEETEDRRKKSTARQVECIEQGSVVFETLVQQGVTGTIVTMPFPPMSSNSGKNSGGGGGGGDNNPSLKGTVALSKPIHLEEGKEGGVKKEVTEVSLWFEDLPKSFQKPPPRTMMSSSPPPTPWLREGDVILFDVVKDSVDDALKAAPTTCMSPTDVSSSSPTEEESSSSQSKAKPSIKLLELSPVGRAEGTIVSLKADYGFINFAERNVDVHFKFSDILPDEMQGALLKQLGCKDKVLPLKAGVGVQFDMSANESSPGGAGSGGRGGRRDRGKPTDEKLRAFRCLLVPSSLVKMKIPHHSEQTELKGTVKFVERNQLYAGSIDIEEEPTLASPAERHPFVARTINFLLEESAAAKPKVVYPYILGPKEEEVVVDLAKLLGNGTIQVSHIPVPSMSSHPGRICLTRTELEAPNETKQEESKEAQDESSKLDESSAEKGPTPKKIVLRYDKSSFAKAFTEEPPGTGDVVSFKLSTDRRSGKALVRELSIVERNEEENTEPSEENGKEGLGVIREIAKSGQFGFVNVLDESASKVEVLLFHVDQEVNPPLKKGYEVKFEISKAKKGKTIAKNVTALPKGTIPSKASTSACLGYIMLEPSHTHLSDTPFRKSHSTASTSSESSISRWSNVKDKDTVQGSQDMDGIILLLEDKTGMYGRNACQPGRIDGGTNDAEVVPAEVAGREVANEMTQKSSPTASLNTGVTPIHVPYKTGGVAIHGTGAVSSIDGSSNLRRGDLVSFMKSKNGNTARDIRLVKKQEATMIRGRLENLDKCVLPEKTGTVTFIAANEGEEKFTVDVSEVVSCDPSVLKERETVEALNLDGKLFGICRTADLYLESKLGGNHKERPKLNLAVKKDRGGKIIAQSMMAKVCEWF